VVLVAAWAVQELDPALALAVVADRELVTEDDSGNSPESNGTAPVRSTPRSRASTSRAASTRSTVKDEGVASEADRVAPGQLAQGAARTVEVGAVDVGDEVLGAAHSGRLCRRAGPGRRDRGAEALPSTRWR